MSYCEQDKKWVKEQEKLATNFCPECGNAVDEDGVSFDQCSYSHLECKTCFWRPCDDSC